MATSVGLERAHLTLHPHLSEGTFDGAFELVDELGDGKGGRAVGRKGGPPMALPVRWLAGIEWKVKRAVPSWHGVYFPSFRLSVFPSALAACSVFISSIAMVIFPTPPGTGVIAEATSATGPKSTSPTIR